MIGDVSRCAELGSQTLLTVIRPIRPGLRHRIKKSGILADHGFVLRDAVDVWDRTAKRIGLSDTVSKRIVNST
jgi:hypothetical protein